MVKFHSEAVLIERDGRMLYLFIRTQSHAYNHPPTNPNNQPTKHFFIHPFIFVCASLRSKRFCFVFGAKKDPGTGFPVLARLVFCSKTQRKRLLCRLCMRQIQSLFIRHFRNEKGTGAKMHPAGISGIVTGDALASHWLIFPQRPQ